MIPSADAMYSPPPSSPPNETSTGEPSYAPPPGSPPTTNHTSNPAQPFSPGGEQYIVVGLGPNGSEVPTTTEPPPPYTAKASDPPPSWAASPTQLQDITSSAPALPPTHLPLDPPPDFFSTPSPPRIRARSFAPFTIPARGHTLDGGFALLYADALRAHGIAPAHWARFLQDLQAVARLALQGRDLRGARPKTTGLAVGSTRGRVYDAAFVKSPLEQVQGLLEVYNGSAWERRKVRVTLRMQTDEGGRGGGYGLLVEAL
ncbi:hypothetical protein PHLGIDRAFT_303824 [Phlebiopsis gigantea 11061_1 CR5-6]|uniref:Uncharacterized protein n=1 Tax=Phlebiopsis gigantea (strain 11061_1 CR5-6) TaxID=745531 RepID=A0A0C3NCL4_PHLG1|nr:hypothetical protein PHLGIDRAFT_303824 [Phlebiopsis gigantea 11061_1 CR5-6]